MQEISTSRYLCHRKPFVCFTQHNAVCSILHQMKENACNKVIDYLYTCAKTIMYMPFVQHNIKENFPLIL